MVFRNNLTQWGFDVILHQAYASKMRTKNCDANKTYWWHTDPVKANQCKISFKSGDDCPKCRNSYLAYDALFVLTCSKCHYIAESGAFT